MKNLLSSIKTLPLSTGITWHNLGIPTLPGCCTITCPPTPSPQIMILLLKAASTLFKTTAVKVSSSKIQKNWLKSKYLDDAYRKLRRTFEEPLDTRKVIDLPFIAQASWPSFSRFIFDHTIAFFCNQIVDSDLRFDPRIRFCEVYWKHLFTLRNRAFCIG